MASEAKQRKKRRLPNIPVGNIIVPWGIVPTNEYLRCVRRWEKKHPESLQAMLDNLDHYMASITAGAHPLCIFAGYIHKEPHGIRSLDQTGGSSKTAAGRLYLYPDINNLNLHLIRIGGKREREQREDIAACIGFVRRLTKEA